MANTNVSQKVWAKFESKRKDGTIIKLRIEDLPSERQDEIFDFIKGYFISEEAFQVAAGIHKNEEALNEYRDMMKIFYEHHPWRAVFCRIDDEKSAGEIIGLSLMEICSKTDNMEEFLKNFPMQTKEMKQLFHLLKVLEELFGSKEFERYYDGRGIIVHPDYRGLGIANEFVRVRKLICIDEDVPVTSAWMTAIGTQKAAEKYNWKTLAEISPKELSKSSGLKFDSKISTFKLMYTTAK